MRQKTITRWRPEPSQSRGGGRGKKGSKALHVGTASRTDHLNGPRCRASADSERLARDTVGMCRVPWRVSPTLQPLTAAKMVTLGSNP